MADVTGVDNLTSASSGSTSLTGLKAAVDNLNTAKVETSVTVNGHALTGNVTVSAADAGAVPTTRQVNGKALSADITLGLASADFANQGTGTTVLHGNGSGNPGFSAVVEADQTLADNTTNDVSTSMHGYAPKAPNDSTKFLRGDGVWGVPGGSNPYTTGFGSTSGATADGNGHQVTADSFLFGWITHTSTTSTATAIYSDAASTPTTQVASIWTSLNSGVEFDLPFCIPIKKNNYYKIVAGSNVTVTGFIISIT